MADPKRTGMCPHCGAIVDIVDGLTAYHDWPVLTRQVCPGSRQNHRNPESDHRFLWNGEPNPHIPTPAEKPALSPYDEFSDHYEVVMLVCRKDGCGWEQSISWGDFERAAGTSEAETIFLAHFHEMHTAIG